MVRRGGTALHLALWTGHKDMGELLVAKGATISSIHVAAQMGDLARVM